MKSFNVLIPFYTLILFLLSTSISSWPYNVPRLTPHHKSLSSREKPRYNLSAGVSNDLKTYFYEQTLDHFNYGPQSFATFKQRYIVNSRYWGGHKSPIFAYLGEESPIDNDVAGIGILTENAAQFKALIVYIEHRFYGESVPFGTTLEEALANGTTRGYFNSAQALADYAEVLLHVKETFRTKHAPIIVIGGSYGGMLASWFRLKYPHIALGALASSAPILYFDDITPQNGYYKIVTEVFKEESESCYETIKESWSEIDRVASTKNGLSILSQRFKTCSPLSKSSDLKNYLDSIFSRAAQYNRPPNYAVTRICGGIDGAANGTDVLGRIFAGVVAYNGNRTCYVNEYRPPTETNLGWSWQTCSDMVIPIGRGENDTMFPASPFNLTQYVGYCQALYGVPPRPHWVTTYFGGHDIRLALQKFGSNIIFSNGRKDPYSSGGVLESISDSIIAISTAKGSHCLDILHSQETDPHWLRKQRKLEVEIIGGWLAEYYVQFALSHWRK